jgi:hypothetical protein
VIFTSMLLKFLLIFEDMNHMHTYTSCMSCYMDCVQVTVSWFNVISLPDFRILIGGCSIEPTGIDPKHHRCQGFS